MEYVTLNNGVKMPMVGFGVFQIPETECEQAVADAIEVGYRLIDTAQAYYNEEAVGRGIRRSGIDRGEIFLTTKVWVTEHSYEKAYASVEESMRKLQVDYLDLVLIHQCLGDYYAAYHALETLYKEGKVRAIGISNFSAERMVDLCTFNEVKPTVNQVETHLFCQQKFLAEWMHKLNVQHEAWGPLAQHRLGDILANPMIQEIGRRYSKSASQVALRYSLQRGIVIIPKSSHKNRMQENIDLFDFTLTDEEMEQLSRLDENRSLWLEYDDPNIVEMAMS
ncbi:MAG: aldo/keto reductase [Prevotella sp.]|nr:aldo/keto reductase [Prevotella sp.]MBR1504968.1 aldo/keto reductase [Prevotella sp.]